MPRRGQRWRVRRRLAPERRRLIVGLPPRDQLDIRDAGIGRDAVIGEVALRIRPLRRSVMPSQQRHADPHDDSALELVLRQLGIVGGGCWGSAARVRDDMGRVGTSSCGGLQVYLPARRARSVAAGHVAMAEWARDSVGVAMSLCSVQERIARHAAVRSGLSGWGATRRGGIGRPALCRIRPVRFGLRSRTRRRRPSSPRGSGISASRWRPASLPAPASSD